MPVRREENQSGVVMQLRAEVFQGAGSGVHALAVSNTWIWS